MIDIRQRFTIFLIILCLSLFIFSHAVSQSENSKNDIRRQSRNLLKSAAGLIESGQSDQALVLLDSTLQLDENNPDAFYYKGLVLIETGDTTAALELLTMAVEKAPRSTRLKLLLSHLLITSGDLDKAEQHLDQILAIKPNESEALYYKGNILMARGDSTGAITLFERGLEQIHKKK